MGSGFEALTAHLTENALQLLVAIGLLIAAVVLSRATARWARRALATRIQDTNTRRFLRRTARYTVLGLGVLAALDQVPGIHITSFLAGLGIVGFTIGFALQDIARNFIAGFLLLIRQPFAIGDAVEIAGRAGIVTDITIRDTVIKSWDGVMEIIPNLDVYSRAIINYSEFPLVRRTVNINLGRGEDVDRAKEIIMGILQGSAGVLEEPAPEIFTEELGDTALRLAAHFWINQQTHNQFAVHSQVLESINGTARRQGIHLPHPTQVVVLEPEAPTDLAAGEESIPEEEGEG